MGCFSHCYFFLFNRLKYSLLRWNSHECQALCDLRLWVAHTPQAGTLRQRESGSVGWVTLHLGMWEGEAQSASFWLPGPAPASLPHAGGFCCSAAAPPPLPFTPNTPSHFLFNILPEPIQNLVRTSQTVPFLSSSLFYGFLFSLRQVFTMVLKCSKPIAVKLFSPFPQSTSLFFTDTYDVMSIYLKVSMESGILEWR